MTTTLGLFGGGIGWAEVLLLGIVALLVFGRRLPEVAKSMGKGIVEFKKGERVQVDGLKKSYQ